MEQRNFLSYLIECYENVLFLMRIVIIHLRWAFERYTRGHKYTYTCLLGKTAVVTGGNSGLGYVISLKMASRGCKVIIATNRECESERKKLIECTDNPNIITKYIDLDSFTSVRKFAEDIRKTEPKIDFLMNIAGVGVTEKIISEDGLNSIMQINHLGHFLLTHLLIDQLKAAESARVLFVSSSATYYHKMKLHDILLQIPEKNQQLTLFQYFHYYSNAKLCVMVAATELGKILSKYGITVNSIDPGIFHSKMVQSVFDCDAPDATIFHCLFRYLLFAFGTDAYQPGLNAMYMITEKNIENGGHYLRCKPIFKPRSAENEEFRRSIWKKSEQLVGLRKNEKLVL